MVIPEVRRPALEGTTIYRWAPVSKGFGGKVASTCGFPLMSARLRSAIFPFTALAHRDPCESELLLGDAGSVPSPLRSPSPERPKARSRRGVFRSFAVSEGDCLPFGFGPGIRPFEPCVHAAQIALFVSRLRSPRISEGATLRRVAPSPLALPLLASASSGRHRGSSRFHTRTELAGDGSTQVKLRSLS